MLASYVLYVPGLRTLARANGEGLITKWASTLSYALRRLSFARMAQEMVRAITGDFSPGAGDVVALDSMAVTFKNALRHGCAKFNNTTAGGGVLWGWHVNACGGHSPLQVLRVMAGAWSDRAATPAAALVARGPLYLMDRGFWSLKMVWELVDRKVRFVMRLTAKQVHWTTLRKCGCARWHGAVRIERDEIAELGAAQRKQHPRVRLVYARLKNGKDLVLVSGELDWSAERILDAYKQRWHIERFHKFIKQGLGLAHLYSFQQNGLEFQLHACVLLTLLLWLAQTDESKATFSDSVTVLQTALRELRESLGLFGRWRPNVPHNRGVIKQSKRIHGRGKGKRNH
jgi:hypothetical protein